MSWGERGDQELIVAGELDADAVKEIERHLHPLPLCWWCCFVDMAGCDRCIYSRTKASHCPGQQRRPARASTRWVVFDAGPAATSSARASRRHGAARVWGSGEGGVVEDYGVVAGEVIGEEAALA
jgi:hypothetical protein